MTSLDDTQIMRPESDDDAVLSNGHGEPSSVFDVLIAKRAEHAAPDTYDLDVPGYRGLLVLRLGAIRSSMLTKLTERATKSKSPERDFNGNADTVLAACREVMWRAHVDDELQPMLVDGEPIGLDERFAQGLQLDATSGRELVRALFSTAPIPEL